MLIFLSLLAAANPDLNAGKALLVKKQVRDAIVRFEACLAAEPQQVECHWEMGWAYWLKSDWAAVVKHWEHVEAMDPGREGLAVHLAQARAQHALRERIRAGRDQAAKTFSSNVPDGTTLRLMAVGDLMIGTDFPEGYLPEDDGENTFAAVQHWLSDGDLTFGNLEGPLCDSGKTNKCRPNAKPGSCYAFRSPGRYARWYADAGFDLLSTANNHAGDFGEECRLETERLLDEQSIAHSGRPGDIASVQVKGLKIAMIGFHTSPSCHNLNDPEIASALVRSLNSTHDIVIVSFHGGKEGSKAQHVPDGREFFYGEDRGDLRRFARGVIDAGADLVLGHGPHVLRAMEIYQDRLIAYSLGNFATYGRFNLRGPNGLGVVLDLTLAKDGRFTGGRLHPTRQEGAGIPVVDDSGEAVDLIRMLSMTDFPETGVLVAQDGSLAAP